MLFRFLRGKFSSSNRRNIRKAFCRRTLWRGSRSNRRSTFGWSHYTGFDAEQASECKTFGASAPLKELQKKFGLYSRVNCRASEEIWLEDKYEILDQIKTKLWKQLEIQQQIHCKNLPNTDNHRGSILFAANLSRVAN